MASKSAFGTKTPRARISGILNGQIVPVTDDPSLTSAATSWSGFTLEKHTAKVVREDARWGWHRTHVCLITRGTIELRMHRAGVCDFCQGAIGSVYVFPAGFDETLFSHAHSDFELICVELDPANASLLLDNQGPASDYSLTPQIGVRNPHIERLLKAMSAEIADDCPSGALYSQSLSLALASYLESNFSVNGQKKHSERQKLSSLQVRRVAEYVDANIRYDINLDALAKSVSLSPRQFVRLFANTFGSSPLQYVMNKRVDRAMEFLATGLPISAVAQKLGFSSPSHFSKVFRKTTGSPPSRFGTGLSKPRKKK